MVNLESLLVISQYNVTFRRKGTSMHALIAFFLKNSHLNHLLLLFLLAAGIFSYINIPKEMFPDSTLKKIVVTGAYPGASAAIMDKIAVHDLEENVGSIGGIKDIDTIVRPGMFSMVLTLEDYSQADRMLGSVKDAIAKIRQNLPADMNEPVAMLAANDPDLVKLAISSESLDMGALLKEAKRVRSQILDIEHISQVFIYGESEKKVEIGLDAEALKAYGLDPADVIDKIRELSYIFPVGNIDDNSEFIYLSTVNGKKDVRSWKETLLHIGEHYLYLDDIADIKIYYPEEGTLSSYNGKKSLILSVLKDTTGDALKLSDTLHQYVERFRQEHTDIGYDLFHDNSVPVRNRLDIIISNLTLGLILVFFTMYFLINRNTALIVTMGVPFAFIIGLIFIYQMGYSLNIVSLVGAILVVGIAVDDAVVVTENIQRHIDEGMEATKAAYTGVIEMILPVTLATLTTVAAFIPIFMISGETMLLIKLIPVVVIMVLLGSLLESFFFLPLHAKTLLRRGNASRDWSRLTDIYEKTLHRLLKLKKRTIALFVVVVPLLTLLLIEVQHFEFFPRHDVDKVFITGKLSIDTPLESTFEIANEMTKELMEQRQEYSIESIWQVSGYRKSLSGEWVSGANMFLLRINLDEMVDTNFVNRYLNPILDLSFEFDDPKKTRTAYSYEIEQSLRELVKKYRGRYHFEELGVMSKNIGIINTDIELDLYGGSIDQIESAVDTISSALEEMDDITEVVDGVGYGKTEYQISVNAYGEQLGLTEGYVASTLSGYFLGNRKALTFDDDGVIEITTEFIDKDRLERLVSFELPLSDGRFVRLDEVVDLIKKKDYEMIVKRQGEIVKQINANIDKTTSTVMEVMQKLQPTIDGLKAQGVTVDIHGEQEKNEQLRDDMIGAVGVALVLILILLLLIFPKIKYALMVLSVIPLSIFGALLGHEIMGLNITMPSVIGMLGLAGVVINDGIIMLDFLHGTHHTQAFYQRARQRLRPIIITSITTFIGLSTLIFFASGQAKIMQPLAVSLGFGLIWGTVVNLLYLPTLYAIVNKIAPETEVAQVESQGVQSKS